MRHNSIKKNSEAYVKAIGLNTLILLSKEIFPANEDIKVYIDENVKIELKDYLYKSRTMLVARVNRYIYDLDSQELKKLYKSMNDYLNKKDSDLDYKDVGSTKKNKSKENLKTWLDNI